MQLLLLAAGAPPAHAPGTPAAAGSDGSGFGAVLGKFLGDKATDVPVEATAAMASAGTAQGTQALQGAAPAAAEEATENAGAPDGGAAVTADVPATVPNYAPGFGQTLLSAPVLVPVAVPVPRYTPSAGAATAVLPHAESAGPLLTSAVADLATPGEVPGETKPAAGPALTANPGAAIAAGPASAASTSVPVGTGSATSAASTTPAVSTTTAASSSGALTPSLAATEASPVITTSPPPMAAASDAAFPAPVQSLPAVQPNTPAPAPAPLPDPARLTPQLAGPLFSLAHAAPGQHVMTLQVSPEDLGPLTVRAHIDAAGVRIELFAPGEVGRDALRIILPELRRGLAESGLGASLDLSDHSAPPDSGAGDSGRDRRAPPRSQQLPPEPALSEQNRPGRILGAAVLPWTVPAGLDILV